MPYHPSSSPPLIVRPPPPTPIQVQVTTSSGSDPFDGDVYVTMTGLDGTSEEQRLTNGQQGNFLAGAVSDFTIKAGDVGQLSSLSVRMVGIGRGIMEGV